MTVTSATLRRLAGLEAPIETLREVLTMLADQEEVEERRRAKDRARKKTGNSTEGDRNLHGNSAENPRKAGDVVVDNITTPDNSVTSPSSQQHRSQSVPRGTRLPDDFQPHPNILELARNLGFTDAQYWDHFQRFCDYWGSLSGAKATKLDWNKTWRNRVKDLADHLRKKPNGQNHPPVATSLDAIDAALDERIRSERGEQDHPEDPFGLPRLRQSAA